MQSHLPVHQLETDPETNQGIAMKLSFAALVACALLAVQGALPLSAAAQASKEVAGHMDKMMSGFMGELDAMAAGLQGESDAQQRVATEKRNEMDFIAGLVAALQQRKAAGNISPPGPAPKSRRQRDLVRDKRGFWGDFGATVGRGIGNWFG